MPTDNSLKDDEGQPETMEEDSEQSQNSSVDADTDAPYPESLSSKEEEDDTDDQNSSNSGDDQLDLSNPPAAETPSTQHKRKSIPVKAVPVSISSGSTGIKDFKEQHDFPLSGNGTPKWSKKRRRGRRRPKMPSSPPASSPSSPSSPSLESSVVEEATSEVPAEMEEYLTHATNDNTHDPKPTYVPGLFVRKSPF